MPSAGLGDEAWDKINVGARQSAGGPSYAARAAGTASLAMNDAYETNPDGTITRAPSPGTGAFAFFRENASPAGTPPAVGSQKVPLAPPGNVGPFGALLGGFSTSSTQPPSTWFTMGSAFQVAPPDASAVNLWLQVNDAGRGDNARLQCDACLPDAELPRHGVPDGGDCGD